MVNSVASGNETNVRLPGRRRWIFASFARKGVKAALALSCTVFAVYLGGSMPDPGFSDRLLFLLLWLLRYSALFLSALSLLAMGFSVHRLVHHVCVRNILGLCLYFAAAILGAGFAIFNSMIIAAAGGNG
jgi:hypothetical protein